jgi:hypothetical protein
LENERFDSVMDQMRHMLSCREKMEEVGQQLASDVKRTTVSASMFNSNFQVLVETFNKQGVFASPIALTVLAETLKTSGEVFVIYSANIAKDLEELNRLSLEIAHIGED